MKKNDVNAGLFDIYLAVIYQSYAVMGNKKISCHQYQ